MCVWSASRLPATQRIYLTHTYTHSLANDWLSLVYCTVSSDNARQLCLVWKASLNVSLVQLSGHEKNLDKASISTSWRCLMANRFVLMFNSRLLSGISPFSLGSVTSSSSSSFLPRSYSRIYLFSWAHYKGRNLPLLFLFLTGCLI